MRRAVPCLRRMRRPALATARASALADSAALPSTTSAPETPLWFVCCRDSGPQTGAALAARLRDSLGSARVVELPSADGAWDVSVALRALAEECSAAAASGLPTPRLAVAGGDGSVNWLLAQLEDSWPQDGTPTPPVSVLPGGTGNDLARSLGCTDKLSCDFEAALRSEEALQRLVSRIRDAPLAPLDRWSLSVDGERTLRWSNYCSIGFDAGVALSFDMARKAAPSFFTNRLLSKAVYGAFGVADLISGRCQDLAKQLTVEADGVPLELPEGARGILLLSISSFMGGVQPWSDAHPEAPEGVASASDAQLEVAAHYGALHLALMQLGLGWAVPLARCSRVRVRTSARLPVQADGEPWEQEAGVLEVEHVSQARVCVCTAG